MSTQKLAEKIVESLPRTQYGIKRKLRKKNIKGMPQNGNNCPIANLLKLNDDVYYVSVNNQHIHINNYAVTKTPPAVRKFVMKFDRGEEVEFRK